MKKSILALAVLSAFAGVASAQSSVTLYGRADVGFTRFDPKAGNTSDVSATTGISSGNLGGSRWGIRGSEDLGGGMKGIFTLEGGYGQDDGTLGQGGRLFGRQAWAGLEGGFGSFVMGRIASFSSGTGSFDKFGGLDPFRTGYGNVGLQATFASSSALRLDNTVAYMTPNMGGFSAGAGYTFRAGGQELAGGNGSNNAGYITYINFGSGPFYGVVTYDNFKLGEVAGDPSQKHLQVGLSWDFKVIKLSAAYASETEQYALGPAGISFATTPSSTASTSGAVQATATDATAYMVGAIVPIGPHRLAASYQSRESDAIRGLQEGERTVWTLGYEYSFSRRTTGYIVYGNVSDKKGYKSGNWGGITQTFVGLSHAF